MENRYFYLDALPITVLVLAFNVTFARNTNNFASYHIMSITYDYNVKKNNGCRPSKFN